MTAGAPHRSEKYGLELDRLFDEFQKKHTFYSKKWIDQLLATSGEGSVSRICIWGTGSFGVDCCLRYFGDIGIPVAFFCDSDPEKWGREIVNSVQCISPEELSKKMDMRVVIAVSGHQREIAQQCRELGFSETQIFNAPLYLFSWAANYRCATDPAFRDRVMAGTKELLDDFGDDRRSKVLLVEIVARWLVNASGPMSQDGTQYFIPELPIRCDEAFVDAGAYDGDTLRSFIDHMPGDMPGDLIHYYTFECDQSSYVALKETVGRFNCPFSVEYYPIALWDQKASLHFSTIGTNSLINNSGKNTVQADRLENVLLGKPVTWIKMDIEGAEMRALEGCASIIRSSKPRLSICTYHNLEDIFEIPRYIKSLRDDYRFLLRHHSELEFETVLYAY